MAGIGFTLPFLPLYLGEQGLSDRAIGIVSTLAALAGLAQFPIGVWSDHIGRRKPFLIAALAVLALASLLLPVTRGPILLGLVVVLFAENGLCRATVESLSGAEATHLAPPGQVGKALGALRFWKPIGIVLVAFGGGMIAESISVDAILWPLALLQILAVAAALLIHDERGPVLRTAGSRGTADGPVVGRGFRDPILWVFVAAMVLFHVANAPGGVYLGLYLKRDLHAPERYLAYAFVVSMIAWMLAIRVVGSVADRFGRKPFLMLGGALMALRLAMIALATSAEQILAIQVLDGLAQSLFAVAAAAWVTDRLADPRRVGEAQVLVGSSLVFGSAVGPLLAALIVDRIGYVGLFGVLAGIGAIALVLVIAFVPETLVRPTSTGAVIESPALLEEEILQ
jgi:MFS family permease